MTDAPPADPKPGWHADRYWDGQDWYTADELGLPDEPAERNTAALVGFILSLIIFVPLLPLVGGIVSATQISRANQMKAEGNPAHNLGYAIAGTVIGLGFTLLLAFGGALAATIR